MRQRLLLDCDGVLADMESEIKRQLGLPPSYTIQDYDLSCAGKHPQEVQDACQRAQSRALYLQPYPDVRAVLSQLRAHYEVHCVTALQSQDRVRWLCDELDFRADRVHLTQAKTLISGSIFVDDHPEIVEEWQRTHPYGLGYVMDRTYNRHLCTHLPRISNLEELF